MLRPWEVASHVPGSGHEAMAWLSTWTMPPADVAALERRWKEQLARLFG